MEDWNGVEEPVDRRQAGLVSLDDGPLVGWSQGRYFLRPAREASCVSRLQYTTLDSRGSHCTVLGTIEFVQLVSYRD